MNDDDRLHERFAELRANDARRPPPFDAMWTAPPPRRSPWVLVAPLVRLSVAAAALLFVLRPAAPTSVAPASSPPMVVEDPAPLDFLLEPPLGASLARAPDFDQPFPQGVPR